jgi:hypothetical protein
MSTAVKNLTVWFETLSSQEKREVLNFLYEGHSGHNILLQEGFYCGPHPRLIKKGLFTGPAPISASSVCEKCGRPF